MWDAIDQLLPRDRLAVLGSAAALLGLAVLAVLVFGQARELRTLREWASARAIAQNGHVDAAPADADAAEQATVADHRPAAAQNPTAGVTDIVEDDAGDQSRTTARAR
jgi:type II secretory pathway component PulM